MNKCIYALDAGGSFLKCGLVDADNIEVLDGTHDSEAVNSTGGSLAEIRAAYSALAARARARAASLGYEIAAVGMDTPGPFEYKTGTFRMRHKYTALYGVSVLPWFAEDLPGRPVHIIHDSSAFMLGASRRLPAERRSVGAIAAVMLGTGLGFAIMRDGAPLTNAEGGPRVSIYRAPLHGTEAEELISARGITNRYAAAAGIRGSHPDAKAVACLARAGDRTALTVYADTGRLLGELLLPLLHEYDIHTLLLGGQISRDAPLFSGELSSALPGVEITSAASLDNAHLVGVAMSLKANLGM